MSAPMNPPYDVLGIGFGPSNLALTIALADLTRENPSRCRSHFIERQPHFTWHGGMLLPGSDMQISFLKDLVSLRDPTSPLTFVNYLHKQGRLVDFANCRTFYPSRIEFNDYLRWVAGNFEQCCSYGEEVLAVEPDRPGDSVGALRVVSRDASGRDVLRYASSLVIAVGGAPHVPPLFAAPGRDPRLLHSSRYLELIEDRGLDRPGARVAVIGGGQSAAEITVDLQARFPQTSVDLIFRGHALKPSDSSPLVNEIFHPTYTDFVYDQSAQGRDAIVRAFRNTNYAVVDPDLLETLYKIIYQQKVERSVRVGLVPRTEIVAVEPEEAGIALSTVDRFAEAERRAVYDAVVLATGYERNARHDFLEPVSRFIPDREVDRDYRLPMRDGFAPASICRAIPRSRMASATRSFQCSLCAHAKSPIRCWRRKRTAGRPTSAPAESAGLIRGRLCTSIDARLVWACAHCMAPDRLPASVPTCGLPSRAIVKRLM